MITKLTRIARTVSLFAPMSALAKPACNTLSNAHKAMFITAKNNDMVASCQANGACILTVGARNKAGSVNTILFIGVQRSNNTWRVNFSSLDNLLDISQGITLQIDENESMYIPPRSLMKERDPRVVRLSSSWTSRLRKQLMDGKKSTWTFSSINGQKRQRTVPHAGLREAMIWLVCKVEAGQ